MDLNKEDIKALSADTRVAILKSLGRRRKMPAELAKEFGLASSTITEHLKHLEISNLVNRKTTGHKWIYYELTEKGLNVITPKFPLNIVLGLAGGIVFILGGLVYQLLPKTASQISHFAQNTLESAKDMSAPIVAKTQETAQQPIELLTIALVVIGAILIGFGLYRKLKR